MQPLDFDKIAVEYNNWLRSKLADPSICGDCRRTVDGKEYLTEVNPPGGYGRAQLLVCDDCMRSDRWHHWRSKHWPNWPEPRR